MDDDQLRERTAEKSAALHDSTISGSVIQAGEVQGGVHFHAAERWAVRPREVPSPPVSFINRGAELARLDRFADEAAGSGVPLVAVISGIGGVGKTALLRRWLHRRGADFPDGQLYVDLHGYSPQEAMPPGAAVRRFLRSLGVAPDRLPADAEEAAALYRTLTAGRRVAVLADNAGSAAQLRALIPGAGASVVAVTSRRMIRGLLSEGARFLDLDPLDERSAVALLESLIGADRAYTDFGAVQELTELCGRLPIAIGAVAARIARRRFLSLDQAVRDLSNARRRRAALNTEEDITVHAAFDQAHSEISGPAAALYQRLGLLPGPTFTTGVAATLIAPEPEPDTAPDTGPRTGPGPELGTEPGTEKCEPLLEELLNVHLVEEVDRAHFRLADRTHAAQKAEQIGAEQRAALLRGAVVWYVTQAALADRCVLPGRKRLGPIAGAARQGPPAFASAADALDWLETELPNLIPVLHAAHEQGFHEMAWQMCEAMWGLFISRRLRAEWREADEIGLASARACGDRQAEARMLIQLGKALLDMRWTDDAENRFTDALHVARMAGDLLSEASAMHQLGLVRLVDQHPDEAIPYLATSRDQHAAAGSPRGAALVTRRLGEAHRNAGRHAEARDHFRDAIVRFTAMDDRYNLTVCNLDLAQTHILGGDPLLALDSLDQAQEMAHAEGAAYHEARARLLRADAHEALNDPAAARHDLAAALPLLERQHDPDVDNVRARLQRLISHDGA